MYQYLRTTPIAGKAFLHRLKRLVLAFGRYTPPRSSRRPVRPDPKRSQIQALSSNSDPETPNSEEAVPVPESVLDWSTLEDIRSRGCFVGEMPSQSCERPDQSSNLQTYADIFGQSANARDATFILRKQTSSSDVTPGSVQVPGWVRERAAEVFFEAGDVDSASVVEVILKCLTAVSGSLEAAGHILTTSIIVAYGHEKGHGVFHGGIGWSMYAAWFRTAVTRPAAANNTAERRGLGKR